LIELHWIQILGLVVASVAIWEVASRRIHKAANKDHPRMLSIKEARQIITAHDFEVYQYLPTVGYDQNEKLFDALESLKYKGHIIIDKKGRLVGKVVSFAEAKPEHRTLN
jgi:hypothetical protein